MKFRFFGVTYFLHGPIYVPTHRLFIQNILHKLMENLEDGMEDVVDKLAIEAEDTYEFLQDALKVRYMQILLISANFVDCVIVMKLSSFASSIL